MANTFERLDPNPCFTSTTGQPWPHGSQDPDPYCRTDHKYTFGLDYGTVHGVRPTGQALVGVYVRPTDPAKKERKRTAHARAVRGIKQHARKTGRPLKAVMRDVAHGKASSDGWRAAALAWLA